MNLPFMILDSGPGGFKIVDCNSMVWRTSDDKRDAFKWCEDLTLAYKRGYHAALRTSPPQRGKRES